MSKTRMYWLHALSPTHVGIGRGVGYIDLPIDREGITGWPIIRGSAFKGAWADYYTQQEREKDRKNNEYLRTAFGIAGDDNNSNAGALIPTDAKLVCLPIRSFRGTFAWATSPLCLRMLRRTLQLAGVKQEQGLPNEVPTPKEPDESSKRLGEAYCIGETLVEGESGVYLEDLDFKAVPGNSLTIEWADFISKSVFPGDAAWQEQFKKRFAVLPDSVFDFLCETGTEVHTRVRIDDETKTVADGALWTEESLPAETILAGLIQCERVFQKNGTQGGSIQSDDLLERFAPHDLKKTLVLQIGGKATVGRGQMRCVFTEVLQPSHDLAEAKS